ncbi:MAG: hypothetical protein ACI3XR_08055 [Eubacteriales bacterium]
MKKDYVTPKLEIEYYQLSTGIASNCAVVVNMGDYGGGTGEDVCNDYLEMVGISGAKSITKSRSYAYNVNFWENTCDCYTTAGGPGFFTS